jgi:hypothetical protein
VSEWHRAQVRRWKELHRRGTRPGTWRDQYEAELEKFLLWCLEKGLPFKWAMIKAMRGYMKTAKRFANGRGRGVLDVRGRRGPWDTINACARELGVTKHAVAKALRRGHRCRGLKLMYERPPERSQI